MVVVAVIGSLFGAAYLARDNLPAELLPAEEQPTVTTPIDSTRESVTDFVDGARTVVGGALDELRNTSIGGSVEDSLHDILG